jgi:tRNA A-37 threonylcarbamoyl transferase component Bud32
MAFLHKNNIIHGQLTSSSCYVDSRWNVIVGNWEQCILHETQKMPFIAFENAHSTAMEQIGKGEDYLSSLANYYEQLFWSAPETLQLDKNNVFLSSR